MESRGTVELTAPPERVFDYFANPRNLVMANNPGPVMERSDPVTGPGSWAVLKFDQIQFRVEYQVWERPGRLAAALSYSGFLSGGRRDRFEYEFRPTASGGTALTFRFEGAGGRNLSVPLIGKFLNRLYWRRVNERILAAHIQG